MLWIFRVLRRLFGPVIGITFGLTVCITSLFGNYIVTLFLPMVTMGHYHKRWRELMDRAISFWMIIPMFVYGVKLRISGDIVDPDKPAIIIMNHRTRLDWLYFKLALWRMNPWLMTTYKIALKELLKYVPGIGFGMQACTYVFLKRDVTIDFPRMTRAISYYANMRPYQILMFPEGTDKTAYTTRKSNEYAKKNGFPELNHVLYPRVSGFIHLVNEMKKRNYLTYVYDVTIGYPKDIVQSEVDLVLRGICSTHIHYHIRTIPVTELPDSDEGLSEWLHQTWREKDERLTTFYNQRNRNHRKLDAGGAGRNVWARDSWLQSSSIAFSFCFWITVVTIWLWHMTFLTLVQSSLCFLIVNYFYIYGRYGGVDGLLLSRWEVWQKQTSISRSKV